MISPRWSLLRRGYCALEEAMGILLPILTLASIVPDHVTMGAVAVASLWLGIGHTMLFYFGVYPTLRYRPFVKGLFAFGAGVCWPLWFLPHQILRR